jgi:flagellar hook assembly protein FlgD
MEGQNVKRSIWIISAAATVAALALPAGSPASDNDKRRVGHCTGTSTSKIKVKPDDGRLEVEFEVDQNKNHRKWRVKIKDNSNVVVRDTVRTKAPSGSFSFERRIANRPGTHTIKGVARNKRSDERCTTKVNV